LSASAPRPSPSPDADKSTIRDARPEDALAVDRLDARITGLAKPDYWRRIFAQFSDRPDGHILIAEAGGQILGFIIGEVRAWEFGSPPTGWIFAIGVDPDHRLNKLGSRLFEAMCGRLRQSGVKTVRTMLARDDNLNMAFFRSQGMMGGAFTQLELPLD
jgi:ribosomal protein S18 acetylase RimI-like enzyme